MKNHKNMKNRNNKSNELFDPPKYDAVVKVRNTYRFRSTAFTPTFVTLQSVLGAIGTVCTTTNSLVTVWSKSFKINSVKIWSPSTPGALVSLQTVPISGLFTKPTFLSDTCTSDSAPASIKYVPAKNSLLGDWLSADTSSSQVSLFLLNCSIGSVVDLDVSFTLTTGDTDLSNTITQSITTGANASIYYLYLDGQSTHRYIPTDLETTI